MEVQGLDEEAICEFGAEVAAAGGALVAAGAGGSHVLLPLDFDPGDMLTSTAEPVTVFWVVRQRHNDSSYFDRFCTHDPFVRLTSMIRRYGCKARSSG